MQSEWFEQWFDSPYYHLLYKNRSTEEAAHFVDNVVSVLQAMPGDRLLDLACGKGRHAIAFSQLGLHVTGADLSKESIAFAKQFEHDTLHFVVHDMRDVLNAGSFKFVCNLFTSFGYFKSGADNLKAAQSIYADLQEGGRFLIDFVNRNHAIQNIEAHRHEVILKENVEFKIERSYTDEKFIKDIQISHEGKLLQFQESVNSFTLQQMTGLFTTAGFTLLKQFGSYELDAYVENDSPRMILLFQK
jgi:SAM-dependent methyltransferase